MKIIKPMGMVVCHDVFQWHPHPNPPPSKGEGVRCASLSDMKQSLHASRDMAQANGLTPFDFNRNAQNAISRLVLVPAFDAFRMSLSSPSAADGGGW